MSNPSTIHVRLATSADAGAVAGIYAPYVADTAITFEEVAPTEAEFAGRIETILRRDAFLVAEQAGRVIGFAYASPHAARASYRWSVNTAIYVVRGQGRRGVGRALYEKLFPILIAQGYAVAIAGITLPNEASIGIHERFGFRRIALFSNVGYKLGAWRDVGWWERSLMSPLPAKPAEPVALPGLGTVSGL
jgi:phosphinothricin acetyltransferase